MDDDWTYSGDPRRCPAHPNVVTSSPDGMFDTPCGQCEASMYEADLEYEYRRSEHELAEEAAHRRDEAERDYDPGDAREGRSWTPGRTVVLTWEELAEVNDPDTMDEIATLAVGESTVLGMCDPIERLS
jgi:hypothetical protein